MNPKNRSKRRRGSALITTFIVMSVLSVGAVVYVDAATATMRDSRQSTMDVQVTNLSEAGINDILRGIWKPFKIIQVFDDMDAQFTTATPANPRGSISGTLPGVGKYAAGVISFARPDNWNRVMVIRSVGYIDLDNDNVVDNGEARKSIDISVVFQLSRSKVFDYTYFMNNYGWMNGFNETNMFIQGDVRANANFDFTGGTPVINGSIVAAANNKLDPPADGNINFMPIKWTDANYLSQYNALGAVSDRWRPPYNSSTHGAAGSTQFDSWRDLVYESDATIVNGKAFGATLEDRTGVFSYDRTVAASTGTKNLLDSTPTEEVIMPDLSNLSRYQTLSSTYVDTKATFADGTANPNFGQGAWIEVWNSSTNSYQRLSTNGVITGNAVLVGTSTRPIRINGPVTVTQDVVIKGNITGQGTLYAGRNVHVVGSVRYQNPPSWKGTNATTIENANEKRDFLGLAARGSVVFGNPVNFSNPYPLYYMQPPFTKGRYDENGNYIPPFNGTQVDSTGRMRYQSTISDTQMNSLAEGVNQIDAIIYTNNVAGGQLATGGGGLTINGSIISKDDAMVVYSLPVRMNYDNRIRERVATRQPLIDIQLPRSPTMLKSTWQDWGFSRANVTASTPTNSGVGQGNNGVGSGWNMGVRGKPN